MVSFRLWLSRNYDAINKNILLNLNFEKIREKSLVVDNSSLTRKEKVSSYQTLQTRTSKNQTKGVGLEQLTLWSLTPFVYIFSYSFLHY